MRIRLVTWAIECEQCRRVEHVIERGNYTPMLPHGWGQRKVRNCGSTGYTRYDDLCPKCFELSQQEASRP